MLFNLFFVYSSFFDFLMTKTRILHSSAVLPSQKGWVSIYHSPKMFKILSGLFFPTKSSLTYLFYLELEFLEQNAGDYIAWF